MRIPTIISADALVAENRWALVASLFIQGWSSLGAAISLVAVICICWVRTASWLFACLAAYCVVALVIAIWLLMVYRRLRRTSGLGVPPGSPDVWAKLFVARSCLLGSVWGSLEFTVFAGFDDAGMQFFVTTIGVCALAGAAARNAASPAGVLLPMSLVLVPMAIGMGLAPDHFARIALPFIPVLGSAMTRTSRHIGEQTVNSMLAEQRLAAANEQLVRLSTTDGLTGIGNRRRFDAGLATEWLAAERDGTELALLMLDVDHFKLYNDHYGHLQGDECLRAVALCIGPMLQRPTDLIARYGGEEFVALLPATDAVGARGLAEQLRLGVYEQRLPHARSPLRRVSVSVGVASIVPTPGMNGARELLTLADQALYQAKQAGRNCVRAAGEIPVASPVNHDPPPLPRYRTG